MSQEPTLRAVTQADDAFLLSLYGRSRVDAHLLALWEDAAARAAFLRMQFDLQQAHYTQHYPEARHEIVEVAGEPVGRMWVDAGDVEVRLMDIALVPERRGAGLGSRLMKALMAEARERGVPMRLFVEHENEGARRFYERHGFVTTEDIGTHARMEWAPT